MKHCGERAGRIGVRAVAAGMAVVGVWHDACVILERRSGAIWCCADVKIDAHARYSVVGCVKQELLIKCRDAW